MKKLNLLLVEDDEFDVFLVKKTLERSHLEFDITVADDEENFLSCIEHNIYDAILADNSLPGFSATKALDLLKTTKISIPFILVTGTVSEEFAVQIMKEGAADYILKDRLQRLPNALLNAITKRTLEAEYQAKLNDIISISNLMKEAEKLVGFGSWDADIATGTHHWSDGIYHILGYNDKEVIPSFNNFISRVHLEDQYYMQKIVDGILTQHTTQKYYCRIHTGRGLLPKHVEGEIYVTRDPEGKPIRINGFTRDISDRRMAEIQIIESEKKYYQLFVNNPIPTWVIDNNTLRFLDVNKAAINNYGYSYEEFLTMMSIDIKATNEKTNSSNHKKPGKQSNHNGLWEHKKKDGSIIQVEINTVAIIFEGKKSTLVIANDITDKKEAEQALLRSEENLHLILDLIPQSIFAKDYNGNFLFVNQSFSQLHGFTAAEMIGNSIRNTIPVIDELDPLLQHDREVILSGKTKIIPELNFTKHTGETRMFHVTKLPYLPAGKKEKAVLGIAADITEQKQAESERLKMLEDIIQRNKDLEQFSYIISHNLRAPVANILGISDLMNSGTLVDHEKEFLIEGLTESVKKLDNIIIDLNQITQIRSSVNESKECVVFSQLVNAITDSIGNITGNNIIIKTDFSTIDTFHTIKNYMHSIFYNLITNSIKYKQPKVPLICEISSNISGNNLQLLFKDNGMGIDLKKSGDQVFELYKRFHIGSAEGKGMGLFMVKTHVESMGGIISVTSEVNRGTEFKIEFPLPVAD